jgi:triacylglycerol esterase/lipase EstA (alpha/beta hydrolase family)
MPQRTLGDIQVAAEYLVQSIRTMHARSGRRIAVMGHSQGGMSMRWALRFWPDTRRMVDDVIGMAGSNHGTTTRTACIEGQTSCPPAVWQQASTAHFIAALNSGAETFRGISYTEIFTHTDEVVQPNSTDATSSSALHTGSGRITNVSTQDICPTDTYEHLNVGTIDPVAYALVMDALTHDGPAKPSRIDGSVCQSAYQPGVDPSSANTYEQVLMSAPGLVAVATPFANAVGAPEVKSEPKLRCYTLATGC